MTTRIEALKVLVGGDVTEVLADFDAVSAKAKQMGQQMQRVGRQLTTFVTLPLVAAGAASIKMASDAEEAANKFDVVMGPSAARVRDRLEELTATIPLTRSEMEGLAAGIQDLLVPMGVVRSEAADMSAVMVELAGDLGSFNNVSPDQVLEAMKSALAGASEPMRRFGVDTRVARLEALALEEGLIKQGQTLDQTAMAQAVLLAIQRDSTDAIGDAGRTVDSTANSFKFFARDARQLGITMGQILIPKITPIVQGFSSMMRWVEALNPSLQGSIIAFAGLAAALGPATLGLGTMLKLLPTLRMGWARFGSMLLPGGILIAGLAALAAGFIRSRQEADAALDAAEAATRAMRGFFADVDAEDAGRKIDRFNQTIERLQERVDELRGQAMQAAVHSVADATAAGTRATGESADELKRQADAIEETIIRMRSYRDVLIATVGASQRASEETAQLTTALAAVPSLDEILASQQGTLNPTLAQLIAGLDTSIDRFEKLEDAGTRSLTKIGEQLAALPEGFRKDMNEAKELGETMQGVGDQGLDALTDFATGSKDAVRDFVSDAVRQLQRLLIKMLLVKAVGHFVPGFELASSFGGFRQHGGPVAPGQSFVVGESGPELFVPREAGTVVPQGAGSLQLNLGSLPPYPQRMSPRELALDGWWRQAFGELVADGLDRGVRFA